MANILFISVAKDSEAKDAFDKALKTHPETEVFIDTASSLPIGVNYDKQLIKRTAKGVKNILTSIKYHGIHVRRVVLTSSIASCMNE